MSIVNLALHKDLKLKHQREQSDQSHHSEKSYIWGDIMKAVAFYFQNLELNLCLYIFVLAFLPFIVDLTFGKILNMYEKSHHSR